MALTPEDVLNKSFTATQFRRGYDEQEVDDFLDEVVAELRRLGTENADLKRRAGAAVGAAGSPVPVGDAGGGPLDAREAEGKARLEIERVNTETAERIAAAVAEAEAAEREAAERIAKAQARTPASAAESGGAPAPASQGDSAADAAGVIALAQKVHDEYVAQGRAEHDRLVGDASTQRDKILREVTSKRDAMLSEATQKSDTLVREAQARHDELLRTAEAQRHELVTSAQAEHDRLTGEAQATHDRLIGEARERSTGMVAEAEHRKQAVITALETERSALDRTVAELRSFEKDYRGRLHGFIRGQLEQLAETGSILPEHDGGPAAESAPERQEEHAGAADGGGQDEHRG